MPTTSTTATIVADATTVIGVIALSVVLVLAVVVWFANAQHPEDAAGHIGPDGEDRDAVARRPAGPGAENMSAARPGGRVPPGPPDAGALPDDPPPR